MFGWKGHLGAGLLQYLAKEYKVLRGVKNTVPEVADATPHKQAVPDLQVNQFGQLHACPCSLLKSSLASAKQSALLGVVPQ